MESNKLQVITPEEYYKKANEFLAAKDLSGFLDFQRAHSIIYNDPISKEDKILLEGLNPSELPEDIDLEDVQ